MWKKFGQLHDQSDGQFGQFGRPGQFFFGIFGFRGVNIPKVTNLGKCHDLERKCKMLIQEWAVGHFLVVLDLKKIRGTFGGGGYGVNNWKIYIKYIDVHYIIGKGEYSRRFRW